MAMAGLRLTSLRLTSFNNPGRLSCSSVIRTSSSVSSFKKTGIISAFYSTKFNQTDRTSRRLTIPNIQLNNGNVLPQIGFGLWKVTENTSDVVYEAIKAGYRLFDGAFDYGNEKQAGAGIKRALDEGIVKRDELVIVSKLWNTFHEKDRVEPIARQQLQWWGIDHFDLFYIHFPIALQYVDPDVNYPSGWSTPDGKVVESKATIQETWQAMERLVDIGVTKSIGISNFQSSLAMDLLRYARIRPAVLQVEIHPYLVQEALVQYAHSEGIAVTAYSSFGPQSFVQLKFDKAIDCPRLFDHPVITSIASKHNKTSAQVLLRWSIQRGLAVIPKSSNPTRLTENLEAISFELGKEEMTEISRMNKDLRFNNPPDYLGKLHIFA